MSVCDPCLQTQLIPVCVTNLTIGDIAVTDTDVFIYIKDITTGRLNRFEETSDGSGEVILDLTGEPDFMPDHAYELHITLKAATSIEDKELITVLNGADPVDCLSLRFNYVEEDKSYADITISA